MPGTVLPIYLTYHPHHAGLLYFSPMERQRCLNLAHSLTCLLTSLLLMEGCTSKPPPVGVHFPITNGFHTRLPTEQQRILIWGELPLTHVAEEWLRSHHYSSVLGPPQSAHPAWNREAVLILATERQAEFVLILEQDERKTGALIESHCGDRFNISVTVRGISLLSRETAFRSSAYYPHCVEHTHEVMKNLTCQALATAWGYRPSGQLEIPSSLACTAGQITPPSIR